jgi:hypothetical protein
VAEDPLQRRAHLGERGLVERAVPVGRREPGRQQHLVALAQRDVERAGEREHHLAARVRAPRLHEAHVPRRDLGAQRELELADPAHAASSSSASASSPTSPPRSPARRWRSPASSRSRADELVAALRAGEPVADARLRWIQALTESLLCERGHVATGHAAEEVLEVIAQIAYTTFANYAANAAGTPVDEAFKPPV